MTYPVANAKLFAMPSCNATRSKTRTQLLIEERLDTSLSSIVAAERAAGKSWGAIARLIEQRTRVTVTDQTIRNWYGDTSDTAA